MGIFILINVTIINILYKLQVGVIRIIRFIMLSCQKNSKEECERIISQRSFS